MSDTARIIIFPVRARRRTPEEVTARERRRANDRRRRQLKNGTPEQRATRKEWRKASHLEWHREFGPRLRTVRLALGITEAEAATVWRITLRTHRRREKGLSFANSPFGLFAFVRKYDVNIHWLIEGKGDMFTELASRRRKPSLKVVPKFNKSA